jgi:hypothetical protein
VNITFVTGVSCAGKTTLARHLASDLDRKLDIRDLDMTAEPGPSTAWLDWLRWRAAEELHRATEMDPGGGDIVVTGIVWPCRLIESPAWRPARKAGVLVHFVMLDPPWKVLRERLAERTAGKPRGERTELRRYNRELRPILREQVLAVRSGCVAKTDDLAQLQTLVTESWWSP